MAAPRRRLRMEDYEKMPPASTNPSTYGRVADKALAPPAGGDVWTLPGRSVEVDEDDADDVQQELPSDTDLVWGAYIIGVSSFDIFGSMGVSIISFCYAYRTHSISLVCLGIQVVSHLLSSLLLVFRFSAERRICQCLGKPFGGSADDAEMKAMLKKQRRLFVMREQSLTTAMGLLMLLSSVILAYRAYIKAQQWDKWHQDHSHMDSEVQLATECLAWYGSASYLLQAAFRYVVASKLRRDVLWSAFALSLVALAFLLILGFAATYQKVWSWHAEPFAAVVLAMATMIEGLRQLLYMGEDVDVRLSYDPRA